MALISTSIQRVLTQCQKPKRVRRENEIATTFKIHGRNCRFTATRDQCKARTDRSLACESEERFLRGVFVAGPPRPWGVESASLAESWLWQYLSLANATCWLSMEQGIFKLMGQRQSAWHLYLNCNFYKQLVVGHFLLFVHSINICH